MSQSLAQTFNAVATPEDHLPVALPPSPAAAAERILAESPYHQIRHLHCEFHDGMLMIAGRLDSFHLKQLAQIAVGHLDGVAQIRNVIEVAP
jgi:hypothetical protein